MIIIAVFIIKDMKFKLMKSSIIIWLGICDTPQKNICLKNNWNIIGIGSLDPNKLDYIV